MGHKNCALPGSPGVFMVLLRHLDKLKSIPRKNPRKYTAPWSQFRTQPRFGRTVRQSRLPTLPVDLVGNYRKLPFKSTTPKPAAQMGIAMNLMVSQSRPHLVQHIQGAKGISKRQPGYAAVGILVSAVDSAVDTVNKYGQLL